MKPPTIAETISVNVKLVDQLKIELLQGRYRPLAYTTERRSRIRELQRETAQLRKRLQAYQQLEIPGQLRFRK